MWTERWSASAPITIPASTLEALHTLRERGDQAVSVHRAAPGHARSVQELSPFDGYVTLSGQYCFVGDQVPAEHPMPPEAVEELVAAAEGEHLLLHFPGGEEIYLNCIKELTRPVHPGSVHPDAAGPAPATLWAGRIYQAVTFLSREQEHLLLDRAPHLKTTRWHPNFLDVIRPPGERIWEWMPFWTTSASRWKTAWPLATEKTTCPC